MGESTVKMEIPELSVAISYDIILDDIEEDLLIDASILHNAQISHLRTDQEGKGV